MMTRPFLACAALAALATGCDSLVSGECEPGMSMIEGQCRLADEPDADPGPDPGPEVDAAPGAPDAAPGTDADPTTPDAPVCTADVMTDPMNCGACGVVCITGLCAEGACVGDVHGHAVVIGHDYASHHPAMSRVIGNAAALSTRSPLRIVRWRGTATAQAAAGSDAALAEGLAQVGRPWTAVSADTLTAATDGSDVIVIYAQRGASADMAALGASLAEPFDAYILGGGVIVVLEGDGGTSHALATAAGLATITAIAPANGTTVSLGIPTDGVATGVPLPYYGAASTVWFTTPSPGVLLDDQGHPVAIHTSP
jgi:hypothetical protein